VGAVGAVIMRSLVVLPDRRGLRVPLEVQEAQGRRVVPGVLHLPLILRRVCALLLIMDPALLAEVQEERVVLAVLVVLVDLAVVAVVVAAL
jgi:hypothetical protein